MRDASSRWIGPCTKNTNAEAISAVRAGDYVNLPWGEGRVQRVDRLSSRAERHDIVDGAVRHNSPVSVDGSQHGRGVFVQAETPSAVRRLVGCSVKRWPSHRGRQHRISSFPETGV